MAVAQPNSKLRPDETVLLYADSFEGNIDPVYAEKLTYKWMPPVLWIR